ncbi:MAG: hypothetical protein Q7R66_03505, partial [Undibacterium sp.]|uniref:hypothetical protein n=1 Tax=Undibacterium sp. TaxID=1914977 RepID=UPI002724341B
RGLAKNATPAFTALALANIYLSRSRLMTQVRPCGRKTSWHFNRTYSGSVAVSINDNPGHA